MVVDWHWAYVSKFTVIMHLFQLHGFIHNNASLQHRSELLSTLEHDDIEIMHWVGIYPNREETFLSFYRLSSLYNLSIQILNMSVQDFNFPLSFLLLLGSWYWSFFQLHHL